jgi:mitogen-activated protein kinase kinase kinase 13
MAHRRSPPTRAHILPISPSPATGTLARRRKYTLRRSPNSRRRALGLLHPSRSSSHASTRIESEESDDEEDRDIGLRPVLAALHQNLRKLPSRLLLTTTRHKRDRDSSMRDISHERDNVQIGTKRKRVASSNENAAGGPSTRGSRMKRIKATRKQNSDDDDDASEMEVDTPTTWAVSDNSDSDEGAMDSCQYCVYLNFIYLLTSRVAFDIYSR